MSKALRLSEKWFHRGLWLVALVFAGFLIGLGGTIVGDLPKVEAPLRVDDFLDKPVAQALRDKVRDAQQAQQDAQTALEQAQLQRSKARSESQAARRKVELRVFLYRLALTLPLLVVAGWLFVKKRKGTYWPFVWGFIFFALFAFFVELVPYLPSYGGYVRYVVGIAITALVGRYAILALNRYLERQKLAESMH